MSVLDQMLLTLPGLYDPPSDHISDGDLREYRYTAERFIRARPEAAREIIRMRIEGAGIRQIKRIMCIHHGTIDALMEWAEQSPAFVDTLKREAVGGWRRIQRMTQDRMRELLADEATELSLKDLGIVGAIAADKLALLTGQATSRVDVVVHGPAADDYMKAVQDAEVLPAPVGMDQGGDTFRQTAGPDPGGLGDNGGPGASVTD